MTRKEKMMEFMMGRKSIEEMMGKRMEEMMPKMMA
jgi:hypothetical protein